MSILRDHQMFPWELILNMIISFLFIIGVYYEVSVPDYGELILNIQRKKS